jgi:hypothetical protein
MAFVVKDRVQETCNSPGTGTITLLGAVTGYQAFSAAIGNGNTTFYAIVDQGGSNWEVGLGTYSSTGNTLARTTVLASSNGGSLTNFSSGLQNVWCDYPAGKAAIQDASGVVTVPVLATNSTVNTTPTLSFNGSNSVYAGGASVSGNYLQFLLQNKSGTVGASTNYVLSNDLGTDSTYYGEFGMNSSVFSASTPSDFFSINNGIYFSGHDGDISIGSGNGFKTYLAWGTTGQSAHVINASGALGFSTNLGTTPALSGTTGYGTAGQVPISAGSTGAVVWSSTPTLTGTNFTGVPISTAISGLGTGVATALAIAIGSAGAPVTFNGALGTPSSGTLTNTTGFPAANLAGTALPSAIVTSSLTSVGTITTGTWSGLFGAVSGANLTNLTAGNLSGTISSGVLGNSTLYVGTTAIALNRASAALTLTGVSLSNLTIGTGLSGTSYNGSTAVTINNTLPNISWQTTQSANFSSLAGNGYPVNTTSGSITATLPASPTANQIVTFIDYASTFGTNNLIINPNGNKINGFTSNKNLTVNGESISLVYIDSAQGWIPYSGLPKNLFSYLASYIVIAGGGGGSQGGGGGAGGYRSSVFGESSGGGSSAESQITFNSGVIYSFSIGAGGVGTSSGTGNNGSSSSLSGSNITTITSLGGGTTGTAGGSGGGANGSNAAGTGTSGQGYNGNATGALGNGNGGGGGAGVGPSSTCNGSGGVASLITGSSITRAGGGGGGVNSSSFSNSGGAGGGGNGGVGSGSGVSGTANTGGGGGSSWTGSGANGGSGVIFISIPTANYTGLTTGSPTVSTNGSYTILTFTASGTYTA